MTDLLGKIMRGLRKPPGVIVARMQAMLRTQAERIRIPVRRQMKEDQLLRELGATSMDSLWKRLAERPFPAWFGSTESAVMDELCGDALRTTLMSRAEAALAYRVDLLGSGPKDLGPSIDWHTDFKTGLSWPPRYFADIDYNNPERPSDVKLPWELSRLQWLMPVGQAYVLTHENRYAQAVREVLEQWIDANPCGGSVNWSCTMEAALRVFSWVWFFHVFHDAPAWRDSVFRLRFLRMLYLHVEFTDRHIERSDVNGNHYTADAAGLVMGGLFFGEGAEPKRWQDDGWRILMHEILCQIYPDGVDFEASVPYHRLVTELFLWPAMYRSKLGLAVDEAYTRRLRAMAVFVRAYTRPNGGAPLWGDADDARVLPLGIQDINDHRYLPTLIGLYLHDASVLESAPAGVGEVWWVHGPLKTRQWYDARPSIPVSQAFPDGGVYVMRSQTDHVFIDCGPVGLAGRGGHGHNDCLAFEAMLDGVSLVTDCGAYLYTASYEERNRFRSTASHNTPQVDEQEINRFVRPDYLWNLYNDALPRLIDWHDDADYAWFHGEHSGYRRLKDPVTPCRRLYLDKIRHALLVDDHITGYGIHRIEIPLHLAPGVTVESLHEGYATLEAEMRRFKVIWCGSDGFQLHREVARVSPSYGRVCASTRLVWRAHVRLPCEMAVLLSPMREDVTLDDFKNRLMLVKDSVSSVFPTLG